MGVNFFVKSCQTYSSKKLFGLCDNPSPAQDPAYIDEDTGSKWIAVVANEYLYKVTFTAIDHCIEIRRKDGTMDKRCDGALTYNKTVIFTELKERGGMGNAWVTEAEKQLRVSIARFENEEEADGFTKKKAYIANNEHPKFKISQTRRMDQFLTDTGYILRIENWINLD